MQEEYLLRKLKSLSLNLRTQTFILRLPLNDLLLMLLSSQILSLRIWELEVLIRNLEPSFAMLLQVEYSRLGWLRNLGFNMLEVVPSRKSILSYRDTIVWT